MTNLSRTLSLLPALLAGLLGRCSVSPVAGGISDHGNSRIACAVYRQDRTPLIGAVARLRGQEFLADTAELENPDFDARTDSRGTVAFDSLEPGTYYLEVLDSSRNETLGVVLRFVIGNSGTRIQVTDTARPTGRITGSIDTAGLSRRPVYVRVPGLDRGVRCDSAGQWTLTSLPSFPRYRIILTSTTWAGPVNDTVEVSVRSGDERDLGQVPLSNRLVEDTLLVRAILDSIGRTSVPVHRVTQNDGQRITALNLENLGISALRSVAGGLTGLVHLDLAGNRLSSLPDSLVACRRLKVLNLSQNALTQVPEVVFTFDSLRNLDLSYNRIPGTLTGEIGRLRMLDTLFIGANLLTALPARIGECARMRFISCDQNQLRTLPAELARCSLIVKVNCNDNRLDSIPQVLGSWQYLRVFNAHVNRLVSLPPGFAGLDSLMEVRLHVNTLTSIPFTADQISRFSYFTFHGNRLCGLPDSVAAALEAIDAGWRGNQACP